MGRGRGGDGEVEVREGLGGAEEGVWVTDAVFTRDGLEILEGKCGKIGGGEIGDGGIFFFERRVNVGEHGQRRVGWPAGLFDGLHELDHGEHRRKVAELCEDVDGCLNDTDSLIENLNVKFVSTTLNASS